MGLRGPVTSLPVTKGAERAKRVERGPGGGLAGLGAGGLWRRKGWETLGSQTPTKTGSLCGRQTASGAWAGTAHRVSAALTVERGTTFHAHGHCQSNRSRMQRR